MLPTALGFTAMHSFPIKNTGNQGTMRVMIRKHYIDHPFWVFLVFQCVKATSLLVVVYLAVILENKVGPLSSFQLDSKDRTSTKRYHLLLLEIELWINQVVFYAPLGAHRLWRVIYSQMASLDLSLRMKKMKRRGGKKVEVIGIYSWRLMMGLQEILSL